jgi:hypothetical protein
LQIAVAKTAKPLDAGWNFGRAIFSARRSMHREGPYQSPAWSEVKQGVPAA